MEGEGRQCDRSNCKQPLLSVYLDVSRSVSCCFYLALGPNVQHLNDVYQLLGHSVLFQNSCPGLPVAGVIYVIAIHFM